MRAIKQPDLRNLVEPEKRINRMGVKESQARYLIINAFCR
jgi:hypothetical protein